MTLRQLLQQAFWSWPDEPAAARELQGNLSAAVRQLCTKPSVGDARAVWEAWLDEWHGHRADARQVLVAKGMRLAAELPAAALPEPEPPLQLPRATADTPSTQPLTTLRGCGPATARRLAARGFEVVGDLIAFLPTGYEDRRQTVPLADLRPEHGATTVGVVHRAGFRGRPGRRFFEMLLVEPRAPADDDDAPPTAATERPKSPKPSGPQLICRWFRTYPGLAARFPAGTHVRVSGTPKPWKGQLQMIHPDAKPTEAGGEAAPGEIVVRYPAVEGVKPAVLRSLVDQACELGVAEALEIVPPELCQRLGLPGRREALLQLHRPPPDLSPADLRRLQQQRSPAHRRLRFDELLLLQLGLAKRRTEAQADPAPRCPPIGDAAWADLPFALTRAQRRAVADIAADLERTRPMQRLLQGDVGSGKTAVAYCAAAQAMAADAQVAVMAPTEILAEQHFRTLGEWAAAAGRRAALLTASTPRGVRQSTLALLAAGQLDLVVGTHALLAEAVTFARLGLAVVDEQHRFGVGQRARLRAKGEGTGEVPHLLVMTATPIPRSLALTVFGDLDLSVIDELPPGRSFPRTHVFEAAQRDRVYERVAAHLEEGRRAFVVCPLVEESESLDLADATNTHADLTERLAPHPVGLLHGRLAHAEKQQALDAFRRGELRVLVATTVVEVGVDVPEAEIMLVESAQRFGLAQLHQLRGRVGRRAGADALCLLLADDAISEEGQARLAVMADAPDGFAIAEADLAQRGPGELLGVRQAGAAMNALGGLLGSPDLIAAAQQHAREVLSADPTLGGSDTHRRLAELLAARWQGRWFGEETG